MFFFIFLSFFIVLTNLFLLTFTLLEKKSSLQRSFLFLLGSLTLWILGYPLGSLSLDESKVLIWIRCSYTGLIFLPPLFFHFVLSLTWDHSKIHIIVKQIGYMMSLGFALLNLLGGLIRGITFKYGFYYLEPEIFYPYYGISFISFISYSSWLLYRRYQRTKSEIEKTRLKYLIIGSCFGILSSIFNMCLIFINVYLLEYLTLIIFNLVINYICVRYKLMEINTYLRKEHIYYLTLGILIGGGGCGILVLQRFFPDKFFLYTILLAFVLGAGLHLLTRPIQQIIEKKLFKEAVDKKEVLMRLSQNITSTFDRNLLLPSLLDVIVNMLDIKTASISLYSLEKEECEITCAMGIDETKRRKAIFSKTKGLMKWFCEDKRMLFKNNLRLDPKFENIFQDIENDLEQVDAILAIPFVGKEGLIGVLCLGEKNSLLPYNDEDIAFLNTLCDGITVALENTLLYEKKVKYFLNTIMALVFAIEAKDKYTKGHCENVGRYAAMVAQSLGLPPHEVENIKIGGYLHDIGKIGIDERILLKPGRLTYEEFEQIKKHPEIGVKILEVLNLPSEIVNAVKYHHERISGNGYPEKLTQDGVPPLPLVASIMGIVDSYDAMISDRPYRKALSKKEAIDELKKGSGKLYDPKIVEVFIHLLEEGKI